MKRRAMVTCVLALACAAVLAPSASAAPPSTSITGTATNAAGQVERFACTFTVQRFANQRGQLVAVGTLAGTLTNTATGVTRAVSQTVTLPVYTAASTGSCQILDLVLGPLTLQLLGLEVFLDTVHLNITAQQGPGNLLGNLLCAVAGLLDQNNLGTALSRLLNQILAILNL